MRGDPELFSIFWLAETLHMTVSELVEKMTYDEYVGWCAYLKIKGDMD